MVAVLCARRDSVYKLYPDLDVYDADRDAFTFRGGVPVVADPPCRGWGRFRWRSTHDELELELARFCVRAVNENGGVLEHPEGSSLWAEMGLPPPLSVSQRWWGHPAEKRTWLHIVGVDGKGLPRLPFSLHPPARAVVDLSRPERERTPPAFAEWLLSVARRAQT